MIITPLHDDINRLATPFPVRPKHRTRRRQHNSMVMPPAVKTTKRDTGQPRRRTFEDKIKGTKHR